ncbi:MAG: DUF2065 domain-containing protein [Gammaproteobacteria bacterium]|nr:DUF2065 domain-containing protein [Gammaproteobacteria bacterium]
MINWQDLFAAVALVMVIEGIMPFLSPDRMRRMMATVSQMSDHQLRVMGLVSMVAGVLFLVLSKS